MADPVRMLIACTMKSGSTYAARVLALYFGVPAPSPLPYYGRREQNLEAWHFRDLLADSYILQLHIKPYPPHLELFRENGLKVFTLGRNLGDVIVSFDDHVRNEAAENPVGYIHDRAAYLAMDTQGRYRYLIRHAVPWYVGFHLMWTREGLGMPVVSGRYEDMTADPFGFFSGWIAGAGFAVDGDKLRAILADSLPRTRFNKGVVGRSREAFSAETRRMLEGMLADHPHDLSDLIDELPWRTSASVYRPMGILSAARRRLAALGRG